MLFESDSTVRRFTYLHDISNYQSKAKHNFLSIQGVLLCPQTLSQVRRTELQRAFTEATTDTLAYAKTVSAA